MEGLDSLDLILERHGVLSPRGEELRPGCGLVFLRLEVRARDGGERGPEGPELGDDVGHDPHERRT